LTNGKQISNCRNARCTNKIDVSLTAALREFSGLPHIGNNHVAGFRCATALIALRKALKFHGMGPLVAARLIAEKACRIFHHERIQTKEATEDFRVQ